MGLPVFREPTTAEAKSNVKSDPSAHARSTIRRSASVRQRPHNGTRRLRVVGSTGQDNDTNNETTRSRDRREYYSRNRGISGLGSQPAAEGGAEPQMQTNVSAAAATAQHLRDERSREYLDLHLQHIRNNHMPPPHTHVNPAIVAATERVRSLDEEFARENIEMQLQRQRNRQLPPPQIGQSTYLAHAQHINGPTVTTNDETATALRTVTSGNEQIDGQMRTNLSGRPRIRNNARSNRNLAVVGPSSHRGQSRAFQHPISPRLSPPVTASERSIVTAEEERVQALPTINRPIADYTAQPVHDWQFFGPGGTDGLGDRLRSTSPDSEPRWDTLLTTITPDPSLPSAGSSFASVAAAFPNMPDSTSTPSTPSIPDLSTNSGWQETTTHCEEDSDLSTFPDASDTDSEDVSDAHSIRHGQTVSQIIDSVDGFVRHYRATVEQFGADHRSDDAARGALLGLRSILDSLLRSEDELAGRGSAQGDRLPAQDRTMVELHRRRQRREGVATLPEDFVTRANRETPDSPQQRRERGGGAMTTAAPAATEDEITATRTMLDIPSLPQQISEMRRRTASLSRQNEDLRRETAGYVREAAGYARETEAIASQRATIRRRAEWVSQDWARGMRERMDHDMGEEMERARNGSEHRRGHERL